MTDPQPLPEQPAAPAATASPSDATSMPTEADLSASASVGHTLASNGEVARPAEIETAAAVPVDGSAEAAPAGPTAPAIPDMPPAQTAARLAELFPALFTPGQAKPLKLRIQADIQQRAPGLFNRKSLSVFLHRHTTSNGYLKALANAPARVDLDGQPAGEVSDEHRQAAVAELERRRGLHEARRAAEREAQRAAYELARRARAANAPVAGAADGAVAPPPEGVGPVAAPLGDRPPRPPRPQRDGERGPRPRHSGEMARGDASRGGRPPRPDAPRGRPGGPEVRGPDARGSDPKRDRRPDARRGISAETPHARQADAPHMAGHAARAQPSSAPSPARPPMDDAQRARANVLHAYETTTLTRANFCALKGWTDVQLEATLVEARRERELRGSVPRASR